MDLQKRVEEQFLKFFAKLETNNILKQEFEPMIQSLNLTEEELNLEPEIVKKIIFDALAKAFEQM